MGKLKWGQKLLGFQLPRCSKCMAECQKHKTYHGILKGGAISILQDPNWLSEIDITGIPDTPKMMVGEGIPCSEI